jgi:hypothetical protein
MIMVPSRSLYAVLSDLLKMLRRDSFYFLLFVAKLTRLASTLILSSSALRIISFSTCALSAAS